MDLLTIGALVVGGYLLLRGRGGAGGYVTPPPPPLDPGYTVPPVNEPSGGGGGMVVYQPPPADEEPPTGTSVITKAPAVLGASVAQSTVSVPTSIRAAFRAWLSNRDRREYSKAETTDSATYAAFLAARGRIEALARTAKVNVPVSVIISGAPRSVRDAIAVWWMGEDRDGAACWDKRVCPSAPRARVNYADMSAFASLPGSFQGIITHVMRFGRDPNAYAAGIASRRTVLDTMFGFGLKPYAFPGEAPSSSGVAQIGTTLVLSTGGGAAPSVGSQSNLARTVGVIK